MEFDFCDLAGCQSAAGTVVVIDVCRAFSTAACAFGAGAERIYLTGEASEAIALGRRLSADQPPGAPRVLVMGEVGGMPVEGFDLWNSPAQVAGMDLRGHTLVQRTSAGTQGVVQARKARRILTASFNVAGATARAILTAPPEPVTFVITGTHPEDPRYGQEDQACAEHIAALLRGETPAPDLNRRWKADFLDVHRLMDLEEPLRSQFLADIAICQQIDRFDFAMEVRLPSEQQPELYIMEKKHPENR